MVHGSSLGKGWEWWSVGPWETWWLNSGIKLPGGFSWSLVQRFIVNSLDTNTVLILLLLLLRKSKQIGYMGGACYRQMGGVCVMRLIMGGAAVQDVQDVLF